MQVPRTFLRNTKNVIRHVPNANRLALRPPLLHAKERNGIAVHILISIVISNAADIDAWMSVADGGRAALMKANKRIRTSAGQKRVPWKRAPVEKTLPLLRPTSLPCRPSQELKSSTRLRPRRAGRKATRYTALHHYQGARRLTDAWLSRRGMGAWEKAA